MDGLKGLAGLVAGRAAHHVAIAGRRMLLFLLGGICFIVMLAFLAAALFTWLDSAYGIFIAQFGLAAVFLLIGLILTLSGALTGRSRPHPSVDPLASLAGAAGEPIAPLSALILAFALGFARGMRRRR